MPAYTKLPIWIFSVFVVTVAGTGYYRFAHEREANVRATEQALERSVHAARSVIGDRYHDGLASQLPDALQRALIVDHLTSLAHAEGVDRIYSVVLDPRGRLRVSAGNTPLGSAGNVNHEVTFFAPIAADSTLLKAIKTSAALHTDAPNAVTFYAPFTTAAGHRYLIAAETDRSSLQKQTNAAAIREIALSLLTLLLALPLLLLVQNGRRRLYEEPECSETATAAPAPVILPVETPLPGVEEAVPHRRTDPLTGLPDRHALQEEMKRRPYRSLLIINLHNFREINDFFGVHTGDDLLRQVAHWLQTLDYDPYRLSGDEFAVLIDVAYNREELEILIARFLHRLSDHPFDVGDESLALNVTVGIDPGPELSLAHADIALHEAKEQGSHFAFYERAHQIEEQYKTNIALTKQIHEAIAEGRIICYYQPIVSIGTGEIKKYETLVRMIDRQANIVPPMDFIKIAQKTRLYPKITQTVIQLACDAFRERHEEFAVNLSIRDIVNPQIVRFIEETIVETNTAHRIVFELLESEGIENFDAVIEFITKMKHLGAKIAIDDFGTGYSSMENILRLDIDYIKIDGSLIRNIATDPRHALIVEWIKDFAAKLGAKTVAEFVSSEEIFTQVKAIGIDYAQGYYVGKPAPLTL